MVCEQVSHHPPVTAFHFENAQPGFSFSGTVGDRAKFRGTYMRVKTDGNATLTLRGNLNEEYKVNYPAVDVKGILTGKTSAVLVGTVTIECPTTLTAARIKFGDKGSVKIRMGAMAKGDVSGETLASEKLVVTGTWNKGLAASGAEFWAPRLLGTEARKYFKPQGMLGPQDSWKVWEMVTLHLAMGMFEQAGQFKHELEEKERARAKGRAAAGKVWEPVYFTPASHEIRNVAVLSQRCDEEVWEGATVEISLPVVTREPINPDDM